MARRYEQPEPISKEEATQVFEQGSSEEIIDVLLGLAYYEPDWRWVQGRCLEFVEHTDPAVRRIAALCCGHLTRIHKTIDLDLVLPALQAMLSDPNPWVVGTVQDALDDISVFYRGIHKKM